MKYEGPEKRTSQRANGKFVVSYRILEESDSLFDVTSTKNISLGGMLLTTNHFFNAGSTIALEIRLPFDRNPLMLVGQVVDCKEVIPGLIYDTRLKFTAVDDAHRDIISKTVDFFSKKG